MSPSLNQRNRWSSPIVSQDLEAINMVTQEIMKMFMDRTSVKRLRYHTITSNVQTLPFINCPEAMVCLRNLSELSCDSSIDPEFFCRLSQICRDLRSLRISLDKTFPKGLSDLISVQSNLKVFTVFVYCYENFTEILPSLTNLPKD